MGDLTYRQLAAAILVAHQRRIDGNCLCGQLELGRSHAEHVAKVLDYAGALRDQPPDKQERMRMEHYQHEPYLHPRRPGDQYE
jgi:hypothetical protein